MNEIKINNQFTLYYKKLKNQYLIELHDFDNLCFYKEYVNTNDFIKAQINPDMFFNYFELI
jgi:hypothetical protein